MSRRTESAVDHHLIIEELVIDGLDIRDPGAFRAAFQRILTNHLEAHPKALEGLRSRAALRLKAPSGNINSSAEAGTAVAHQLIRGLGK